MDGLAEPVEIQGDGEIWDAEPLTHNGRGKSDGHLWGHALYLSIVPDINWSPHRKRVWLIRLGMTESLIYLIFDIVTLSETDDLAMHTYCVLSRAEL